VLIRTLVVVIAVAVVAVWYLALPPRGPVASPADETATVRGAIHVHTTRSDGTGSLDDVAAAAARAGLDFVVFTDHGNAATDPAPPSYRSGVLCIDAVEISTHGGHIVALGMPKAPYQLGGEARDVLDDIARMGGMAIAAHPGSLKPELQWTDWTLPVDGIEWLNADSEWRDESAWSLLRSLIAYPARPTESVTALLDRPVPVLQRWDEALRVRNVIAIAAADAHARLGLRSVGEPYDNGAWLQVPSYERMFRAFSNVLAGITLSGDATVDAARVLEAIRAGHLYSRIDAIGPVGTLAFAAKSADLTAAGGDVLSNHGPVTINVSLTSAPPARIALVKDGQEIASSGEGQLEYASEASAGVYRVEVTLPSAPGQPPVPWIVSNPIYVGRDVHPRPVPALRPVAASESQYTDGSAERWSVETSPRSQGAVDVVKTKTGTQLGLRYALGGSTAESAYAGFVMSSGPTLPQFDRISFTANADRPLRLSVQLRVPDGEQGDRWQRSVFIDETPRDITVYFDDMHAAGPTRTERPPLDAVDSILFVVDTVNTPLGSSGRIWIDDVKYGR
jgi:hypothetical protein